ncbi:MAG: FG-GAP-like repeat-containing protein [Planctomycetota bacterium]|nr:FG-GAP-like repeat-containing protein [Planctomycetota bacterium]
MLTKRLILLLLACLPATLAAQDAVTGVSPARNSHAAALDADAVATCTTTMAQPASAQFRLYSRLRGWLSGSVSAGGNDLTFDPAADFLPGEEIEAIATGQLQTAAGGSLVPHVWKFRAATPGSTPKFDTNSVQFQNVQSTNEWGVTCADFNRDGHLDIAVGRYGDYSTVYFNDGSGGFASSLNIGGSQDLCYELVAADFNEDGHMDIAKANFAQQNEIWINNGSGNFSMLPFGSATSETYCLAVGDLNADGHLDIVCGNGTTSGVPNTIHLGDGTGSFPVTRMVEVLPGYGSYVYDLTLDLELADVDNDGDLDLVTAEFAVGTTVPSRIFYNDGDGNFSQYLLNGSAMVPNSTDIGGALQAMCVAVGDLDNDGDLDIVLGTNGNPGTSTPSVGDLTHVAFNQGNRSFNVEYMTYQDEKTWCVRMADFDGDGYLDVIMGNEGPYRTVRINDGTGHFNNWYGMGGSPFFFKCDVADMDGDGDLDVISPRWIYHNGAKSPQIQVKLNGNWISRGDTIQVAHATSLVSLAPQVLVADTQSYSVDVASSISNTSSQGFNSAEWSASAAATPCSLYPTSGDFNVGSITHTFTITADSGFAVGSFVFHVQVGNAPVPVLEVYEGGSTINHNAAAGGGRDFGSRDVAAGAGTALTVTVANQGWVGLVLSSVSLAGADAQDFVLDLNGLNTNIAPGASSSFAVLFDPLTPGVKSAQVQIVHDDPAQPSPFRFAVAGTGTAFAAIMVSEGGSTLVPGAQIAFGSAPVNGSSGVRVITIQNVGSGALNLGVPTLSGSGGAQFALDSSGMVTVVAPGASTSFNISFNPLSAGGYQALVTFSHNDASVAAPFSLQLAGSAPEDVVGGGDGSSGSSGGCSGSPDGRAAWLLLLLLLAAGAAARRLTAARD